MLGRKVHDPHGIEGDPGSTEGFGLLDIETTLENNKILSRSQGRLDDGNSDFSWSALGLINWRPWKNVGFLLGYRALYQDYEDGSGPEKFAFDATIHGPAAGVTINW